MSAFNQRMAALVDLYKQAAENGIGHTELYNREQELLKGSDKWLVREKFAFKAAANALWNHMQVNEITLCYCFEGEFYSVRETAYTKSIEELHNRNPPLNQAQWDAMAKCNIWIKTGNFY